MGIKDAVDGRNQVMAMLNNSEPCMCSHYRRHLNDLLNWTIECAARENSAIRAACQVRTLKSILDNPKRPCWLNEKD